MFTLVTTSNCRAIHTNANASFSIQNSLPQGCIIGPVPLCLFCNLIWCLITGSVDGVEIDQYNVAHGRQRVRRQSSLMLLEYLLADDAALIIDTMP